MPVMPDHWIRKMALEHGMIEPFAEGIHRPGIISYGVSSYGYDFRVAGEFRIFHNTLNSIADPKNFDPSCMLPLNGEYCVIPPNGFVLARTVEYFRIPRDVITICVGKSTYARVSLIVNVTPFEPEWEGHATLELSNTSTVPIKVYANEGIAQLLFLKGDSMCEISYLDKRGKYQNQGAEVVTARVL